MFLVLLNLIMLKILRAFIHHRIPSKLVTCFSNQTKNIRHSPKMSAVQTHFVQAEKFISLEQYHLAEKEIARAQELEGTKEEKTHLLRVRGELQMIKPSKDFKKAIEFFDQAIKASGDYSLESFKHKIICMDQSKTLNERLMLIDSLEQSGKAQPQQYAQKAHILFLLKEYQRALKQYERCQKMNFLPKKDIYFLKGVCLMGIGKLEEAQKEFKIRIKLVPDDLQTLQFLFVLCWKQERFMQAISLCDQILKVNPTLQYAFACKAMCLYALQKWQDVIATLRKVDEDQGSSDKYFLTGMSFFKLNKLENALRDLDQMLNRGADNQSRKIQALFAVGEIYRQKKEYAKALEYFTQTFQTQPEQAINYLPGIKSQIRFYAESGQIKAGQALYTEAAAIHSPELLEEERLLLSKNHKEK